MAVYLFGNLDGKVYQPKQIDLFEKVKKQGNQPVSVKEAGLAPVSREVNLTISKEGLRALHGSKLAGSMDPSEVTAQIAYMSEHQPIESFTSRLSRGMLSSYEMAEGGEYRYVRHSVQEKADTLLKEYGKIYDEVSRGYEDGTRIRYIEDSSSADGFRKLTKEEELGILQSEFDEFVDRRFGVEHQRQSEAVTDALNKFQRIKQSMGRGGIQYYTPEIIPDGFAEQVKRAARAMTGIG